MTTHSPVNYKMVGLASPQVLVEDTTATPPYAESEDSLSVYPEDDYESGEEVVMA